ncbi:MAG: hypothetical protein KJO07_00440, partial [Deltaproteobacteria bacterium]|nr:hypothetical protein [Deltaproteobacteria bacterium]
MTTASMRATALSQLLAEAATRFGQLDRDAELGPQLCRACDRLLEGDAAGAAGLLEWRAVVADWSNLDRIRRAAEVARGMRLLRAGFGVGATRVASAPTSSASDSLLHAPTSVLPGIGPALAERLAEHSMDTVEDLVWLVPRRYDDVRQVRPLAEVAGDPQALGERSTVRAEVASSRFFRKGRRRWVDVRFRDEASKLVVRWFGAHQSMVKRFEVGSTCSLSGKLSSRGGALEMANPDVLAIVDPRGELKTADVSIIPRYRELVGVPAKTVRKAIRAAVDRGLVEVESSVPDAVLSRLDLPTLDEALSRLHAPDDGLSIEDVERLNEQDSPWHQRLAFEELFVLGTVVAKRRME